MKIFIDKKAVELSEKELNQHMRSALMGSVQLLELLMTTELMGYPISDLKRYQRAILKNLDLLESAGTQVGDAFLASNLAVLTHSMHRMLARDDAITIWIKEKYQVTGKQLGVMRRSGKRPVWLDSPEYRAFLKDTIEAVTGAVEHFQNAFQRIKEMLASDGLDVKDHQVDALLDQLRSVRSITDLSR